MESNIRLTSGRVAEAKPKDIEQGIVRIDSQDLEKIGAEMNKPTNIEAVRAIFRHYRKENERLRSALFTLHTHYHKDIADLETRLSDLEIERDFYKRNGHKSNIPCKTEPLLSSKTVGNEAKLPYSVVEPKPEDTTTVSHAG